MSLAPRKIRVLCIGRGPNGGGAERVQLTLLGYLDRRKFEIHLFYLVQEGPLGHLVPRDISAEYGIAARTGGPVAWAKALYRLYQAARGADVIFGMQDAVPSYLSILMARATSRPAVCWIHNIWTKALKRSSPLHRLASWLLYPHASSVICVSPRVKDDIDAFQPLLRDKSIFLPNPHDFQKIRNGAEEDLPEWADSVFARPTVLAVGRLTHAKGFDTLISAFAKVLRGGANLNLLIVGEGPMRFELEALARSESIEDRVFMPGYMENPLPLHRRASLFVLSSRREGLPGVLIEALALGLPIVSTDCPSGPRELLLDGKLGILVPVDDVEALSEALIQGLRDGRTPDSRLSEREGVLSQLEGSNVAPLFEAVLARQTHIGVG